MSRVRFPIASKAFHSTRRSTRRSQCALPRRSREITRIIDIYLCHQSSPLHYGHIVWPSTYKNYKSYFSCHLYISRVVVALYICAALQPIISFVCAYMHRVFRNYCFLFMNSSINLIPIFL